MTYTKKSHLTILFSLIYWANKIRDQTFNAQFLQDFERLVK